MTAKRSQASHLHEVPSDPIGESVALGGIRLVVAPAAGRLRHLPPVHLHDGHEWVSPGQPVAVVEQAGATVEVCSPIEGRVSGFLVRNGEPVTAGQPIVWLQEATRRPGPRARGGPQ
jgi:biotin carboxyl carrier protein